MPQVKLVLGIFLALHLGACAGLMPTLTKHEVIISGSGYGVPAAKEIGMVFDKASPGKILQEAGLTREKALCETSLSVTETKVAGESGDQYRRRQRIGVGDPRNRIDVRKVERTCDNEERFWQEQNRAFERVRRGF